MKSKKRIILVGGGASGKDYFSDALVKEGYMPDISMTTRPIRDGEVEDKTYHYVNDKTFNSHIELDKFYENVEFNGWKYGTLNKYWGMADVFIMTPSGVKSIKLQDRDECVVVFLDIAETTRRKRMSKRSDADSTERRIKADKRDFMGFIDYDYRINQPEFDVKSWIEILKVAIRQVI